MFNHRLKLYGRVSYLESCSSGKQNSRTSLVGIVLIFSLLSAGMLSSSTVPRSGSRSLVRTISLSGKIFRATQKIFGEKQKIFRQKQRQKQKIFRQKQKIFRQKQKYFSTDLYIQWSELLGLVMLVSVVRRSCVAGTLSLLMDTATGPRFSSIPNQFWCSEHRDKYYRVCKYN